MTPTVTVIIRAYNIADIVGRAIESVLAQKTDFPVEILIGEDASPSDNTREVCESYAQQYPGRVRMMPKAPNRGLSNNLYSCLKAIQSEFVACCDGDDYWCDENKLQRQVDFLRANPDYVLVHCEKQDFDGQTGRLIPTPIRNDVPQGDLRKITFAQFVVIPSTALYRRNALDGVNLDEWIDQHFGVDDVAIWTTIAQKGKFHFEPLQSIAYCVFEESISHSKDFSKILRYLHEGYRVLFFVYDRMDHPDFPRSAIETLYKYDLAKLVLSSKQFKWVWGALPKTGLCMMCRALLAGVSGRSVAVRERLIKKITG